MRDVMHPDLKRELLVGIAEHTLGLFRAHTPRTGVHVYANGILNSRQPGTPLDDSKVDFASGPGDDTQHHQSIILRLTMVVPFLIAGRESETHVAIRYLSLGS